jgi:hypothetical protein
MIVLLHLSSRYSVPYTLYNSFPEPRYMTLGILSTEPFWCSYAGCIANDRLVWVVNIVEMVDTLIQVENRLETAIL